MSLKSQILTTLKSLIDPLSQQDIISRGLLQGLQVSPTGKISFILEVDRRHIKEGIKLKEKAESLLKNIPGVTFVQIALTTSQKPKSSNLSKENIPGIKYILVIASGKGGVGKSTTAVNLVCSFQAMGLKTGILDADVYGPSLPRLLGINQKPTSDDGKIMNPLEIYGMKCMSMGFMIGENQPAIWRGPLVQSAIRQMLHQVKWGEIDVLVIDLPPGTGDVQLTLSQILTLSGAIIVSTPQDLAWVDARKALEMFLKVNVPILGLVENMSYFICPHCQERSEIFAHGGVQQAANALSIPLLAEIPLHMSIRETSEKGLPIVFAQPLSTETQIYRKFAGKVWQRLNLES